jgi:hypothetical protein
MGLKLFKNAGATRSAEWNKPNKKAAKHLAERITDYEKTMKEVSGEKRKEYTKPGSMKTIR